MKTGLQRVRSAARFSTHTAIIATVAAMAVPAPAAATLSGTGMSQATFSIQPYSYNSLWQGPMDTALYHWNSTPTPAWITKSPSAPSWVTAAQYPDTWYGQYVPYWNFGRYFDIKLNSRTIPRDATNLSNFVTAVFVHELGHSLNLADNPNTSRPTRMRTLVGDWDTMTTPQQYDIDDVNFWY